MRENATPPATITISRLLRTLLSPLSRNNRRQQCRSQDKQPQITGQRIVRREQVPTSKTAGQSCNHLENHCQNSPAYSSQPAITGSTLLHYPWQQQPGNQENARTQHNPADRQCPLFTDCPDQHIFPQSPVQDCHRDEAQPHYERFQYIIHLFIFQNTCLGNQRRTISDDFGRHPRFRTAACCICPTSYALLPFPDKDTTNPRSCNEHQHLSVQNPKFLPPSPHLAQVYQFVPFSVHL